MNAEFQRIARRDEKAFLRYQCKEIEENKIPKEISCKDGLNKRQKWYMDQQKQKILRRGGKNKQKNYIKKSFTTQIS